jgi:predicted RNA-binding protein with PIN domain
MFYLIDGHNLIPHIPGLSLREIDDEIQLICWLQAFCQNKKCSIEVFFDGAPPGFPPKRKYGLITAHFVRQGSTADAAIQARLLRSGKSARNLSVVSSDRQVQTSAHHAHARVIPSEDFAGELLAAAQEPPQNISQGPAVSDTEIEYWERLFEGENRHTS